MRATICHDRQCYLDFCYGRIWEAIRRGDDTSAKAWAARYMARIDKGKDK